MPIDWNPAASDGATGATGPITGTITAWEIDYLDDTPYLVVPSDVVLLSSPLLDLDQSRRHRRRGHPRNIEHPLTPTLVPFTRQGIRQLRRDIPLRQRSLVPLDPDTPLLTRLVLTVAVLLVLLAAVASFWYGPAIGNTHTSPENADFLVLLAALLVMTALPLAAIFLRQRRRAGSHLTHRRQPWLPEETFHRFHQFDHLEGFQHPTCQGLFARVSHLSQREQVAFRDHPYYQDLLVIQGYLRHSGQDITRDTPRPIRQAFHQGIQDLSQRLHTKITQRHAVLGEMDALHECETHSQQLLDEQKSLLREIDLDQQHLAAQIITADAELMGNLLDLNDPDPLPPLSPFALPDTHHDD